MNRQRLATWMGAVLGTLCALVVALQAQASTGKLTEEFHHTYSLTANGRIELDNINGPVHITAWDQNEVKVDAVKSANTKERLDEAQIEVEAESDYISIRTKYRDHDLAWDNDGRNNPASVEYTIMVPRTARLDEIQLVNGSLDVTGVAGDVRASCVNGDLNAKGLQGSARINTVNGRMRAEFGRLGSSSMELSSVNGTVELTLPSDANAEVEASTVNGGIENDLGIHVVHHRWVGHEMHAELGNGGPHVRLSNVNGRIEVRHANDGRAMSKIKDLGHGDGDDDEI
ncbi:MAG TPA: DUF4097 family beta strand repeat-containing protein [Terriglobales bacterium]|nr:DUF4097 family beta strand repeat-containing protein [Terriglobales bacterium]